MALSDNLAKDLMAQFKCFKEGGWKQKSPVCGRCVLEAHCQGRTIKLAQQRLQDQLSAAEVTLSQTWSAAIKEAEVNWGDFSMAPPPIQSHLKVKNVQVYEEEKCHGCGEILGQGTLGAYVKGVGVFHDHCVQKSE